MQAKAAPGLIAMTEEEEIQAAAEWLEAAERVDLIALTQRLLDVLPASA